MDALERIIREVIAADGPLSVAAYMDLALQHPLYGYYRTREPIGRTGDFITAPEVSQMFGEMVGVWCVEAWRALGQPNPFALLELGPGRGTMMRDLLRATANVADFRAALKLYLIDSDEELRKRQRKVLGDEMPQFVDEIGQIPEMPTLIVANEFFDALPVRQIEKTFRGWAERVVGVENDALVMGLRPLTEAEANLVPSSMADSAPGTVFEFSPKAQALINDMARFLVVRKGSMLLIDYGYVAPSGGGTVQAVSKHEKVGILDNPGDVDLTAHVDFTALADAAREAGAQVSAVIGQGEFLQNCGIEIRAETLKKHATEEQAAQIDSAMHRLMDEGQMGELFKVMEIRG